MNTRNFFAALNNLLAWCLSAWAASESEWAHCALFLGENFAFTAGWLHIVNQDRKMAREALLAPTTDADLQHYPDLLK